MEKRKAEHQQGRNRSPNVVHVSMVGALVSKWQSGDADLPTTAQIGLAILYRIPMHQACTISVEKCQAYDEYLKTDKAKVDELLDGFEEHRLLLIERGEMR